MLDLQEETSARDVHRPSLITEALFPQDLDGNDLSTTHMHRWEMIFFGKNNYIVIMDNDIYHSKLGNEVKEQLIGL